MDPSIRRAFLLGELEVPNEEITIEDWHAMFLVALERCRPYLKYLPGFVEMKEKLNCRLGGYDQRITPPEAIIFPGKFCGQTRCLELSHLSQVCEGRVEGHGGAKCLNQHHLLLTQDGQIVSWRAKYVRQEEGGLGYRMHRVGLYEYATSSVFEFLDELGLLRVLGEATIANAAAHPSLALSKALVEGIRAKRSQLVSFENCKAYIDEMIGRAGAPSF